MESVKQHLIRWDQDVSENAFGIYNRWEICTLSMLTYCSVLRFPFLGRLLPRGWMDVLILGDTRCGKSQIVEGLVRSIGLGEYYQMERTTRAGLIGGCQQTGVSNTWDIVWGKMPLNHGKLLVADEMSSLSVDAIGDMSSVRSRGIAEITMIVTAVADSACRTIWVSNPRSDNKMAEYSFGVTAIRELIGRPEDIARFDMAICVMGDDVPEEIINQNRVQHKYEGQWDNVRQLVKWAWQLQPQEVVFEPKATEAVLSLATRQSREYHPSIPLIEQNEQRVRLARIAVATAVRCFSEKGGNLIVKPSHVEFADWFMRTCYDHRACAYDKMSKSLYSTEAQSIASMDEVASVFESFNTFGYRSLQNFYNADSFSLGDLEAIFNLPRSEARKLLATLINHGCVRRKYGFYAKTKTGIMVMDTIIKGKTK